MRHVTLIELRFVIELICALVKTTQSGTQEVKTLQAAAANLLNPLNK